MVFRSKVKVIGSQKPSSGRRKFASLSSAHHIVFEIFILCWTVFVITVQDNCWLLTMATSTSSYRRSTNLTSSAAGARDSDAALQSKLEQARQQRTAFYRRLARVQTDDDSKEAEVEVDTEMSTRRRYQQTDTSSPHSDVLSSASSTQSSVMEQMPEPRSR